MKVTRNNTSLSRISINLLVASAIFCASCSQDKDILPENSTAMLAVINGSPVSQAFSLQVNGQKFHDKPLQFSNSTGYAKVKSGDVAFDLIKSDSNGTMLRKTARLETNQSYSLYIADATSRTDLVLIPDDLRTPPSGQANLRIVNMSAAGGPVDLHIHGETVPFAAATRFKGFSAFRNIQSGVDLSVELKSTVSGSIIARSEVKLESGRVYTLWAKDDLSTAERKTAIGLITNK